MLLLNHILDLEVCSFVSLLEVENDIIRLRQLLVEEFLEELADAWDCLQPNVNVECR